MIIDVMQHMKNKINSGEWSIKNEPFRWTASENTTPQYIDIEFIEPIMLDEIDFDYIANSSPLIKLYYSYDMVSFTELNYMSYVITDHSNLGEYSDVVIRYENRLIDIRSIYIYNKEQKVLVVYSENGKDIDNYAINDIILLKEFLINQIDDSKIRTKYEFSFINTYSNENRRLYDKCIKGLRIKFDNITLPFILSKFEVYSNVKIDSIQQSLSLINDNFFKSKYFYEFPFLPSITKSFFDMLEDVKID